jgi:3-phenylpropionate/cinnamic acid dioxygenase small subunit
VTDAIQQLLDERDIRELLFRYAHGIDRLDWDLVRSCFHPDATLVYGAAQTVEGFITGAAAGLPTYRLTQHVVTNVRINVSDDAATADAYCQARHRIPGVDGQHDRDFLWGGRYVDRAERRAGEWRLSHRIVVHEWTTIEDVPATWPAAASFTQGQRDRSDVSYR